jgi:hypothetical protein
LVPPKPKLLESTVSRPALSIRSRHDLARLQRRVEFGDIGEAVMKSFCSISRQ